MKSVKTKKLVICTATNRTETILRPPKQSTYIPSSNCCVTVKSELVQYVYTQFNIHAENSTPKKDTFYAVTYRILFTTLFHNSRYFHVKN